MDANNTSKYAITALYKKYKSKRGHMDHIYECLLTWGCKTLPTNHPSKPKLILPSHILAAEYHGGLGMGFFDLGLGTKVHTGPLPSWQ